VLTEVPLISSFRRDVDEIYALLGYYAASCDNCLPTLRDNVSIRRPEKSVNDYHTTPRNIPEQRECEESLFDLHHTEWAVSK
jgi:hypothetical protein